MYLRTTVIRVLVLIGVPLLCLGCLSQLAARSSNPVEIQYGPIAHSRKIGDITCFSHRISADDWKNSQNPFVTIVLDGKIVKHSRLNELLDFLADKEASITRQKATFIAIEVYGVVLGGDVRKLRAFNLSGINTDSRLIRYSCTDNASGWDKFTLMADADGIIEEMDLLTTFRSSETMHSFVDSLVKTLSDKFVPARNDYVSSRGLGLFLISGVPDYESYMGKMRQHIYTDLAIGVQLDQEKGFIPYIINDRLARLSVYYEDQRKVVWLSVRSNRVDARIDRTNEEILNKL